MSELMQEYHPDCEPRGVVLRRCCSGLMRGNLNEARDLIRDGDGEWAHA